MKQESIVDFSPIGTLVSIAEYEVHVREHGPSEGPSIVLVHGFLGSMRWFDRLVPLLSDDFRMVRIDLLGHGFSSRPNRGYSPENQARVLSALLARLDVVKPIVIGFSLGADIAIALMEQGMEVSKLVVIDEGPDYSLVYPSTINRVLRMPVFGRPLYRILPASAYRQVVEGFLAPGLSLESAFNDPSQAVRDVQVVPYACFLGSQVEKERFVAERPLDQRISTLGVATLVIFGEQDQIYQAEKSCKRYRALSSATVEIIPAVGHSPVTENPADTARLIRAFVSN